MVRWTHIMLASCCFTALHFVMLSASTRMIGVKCKNSDQCSNGKNCCFVDSHYVCCPNYTSLRQDSDILIEKSNAKYDNDDDEMERGTNDCSLGQGMKEFECPLNYLCCPKYRGMFECCPFEGGTCCPDRIHCCPPGIECAIQNDFGIGSKSHVKEGETAGCLKMSPAWKYLPTTETETEDSDFQEGGEANETNKLFLIAAVAGFVACAIYAVFLLIMWVFQNKNQNENSQ